MKKRAPQADIYALVVSVGVFVLSALLVHDGTFGIEWSIFRALNNQGDVVEPLFHLISVFGTLGMVILLSLLALWRRKRRLSFEIIASGVFAYLLAYWLKTFAFRARPFELADNVIVRETLASGYGFPSIHAAIAGALAYVGLRHAPASWRLPLVGGAVLVLLSRLYLGVHLPLDVVGGAAVGVFCAGLISLVSKRFS